MVNLENSLLLDILATMDKIYEDPESFDFYEDRESGNGGPIRRTWYKYVPGFGTMAYNKDKGVYIPKDE